MRILQQAARGFHDRTAIPGTDEMHETQCESFAEWFSEWVAAKESTREYSVCVVASDERGVFVTVEYQSGSLNGSCPYLFTVL